MIIMSATATQTPIITTNVGGPPPISLRRKSANDDARTKIPGYLLEPQINTDEVTPTNTRLSSLS